MNDLVEKYKKVVELNKAVHDAGFNGFDLLSWEALIELYSWTKEASLTLFTVHLVTEIGHALQRKAQHLDAVCKTTNYTKQLKQQGILI